MPNNIFAIVKKIGKETFTSAVNHNLSLHGAAIAFYTIFSTAPLIVLVLALITAILGDQLTTRVFTDYLTELTGPDIAASLIEMAESSRSQSSGVLASVLAVGILLFGATTVVNQLKNSLNAIWEITPAATNSIIQFFLDRLISLVIIFMITGLFLASLLLEGGMTFFTSLSLPYLPDIFTPVLKFGSSLISIAITIVFFTLIFRILPDVNARWIDILIGACVTTFLFLIGKYIIGLYLANASIHASYKAAGSFIIFLIWIYYNVQIVLLGAEFTQVYAAHFGKEIQSTKTIDSFN